MQGIDVSYAQGSVDWRRVAGSGVRFAMVKASQGKLTSDASVGPFSDPRFAANVKGARAAGLDVGVYHYLCASSVAEAEREADFFVRNAAPVKDKINLWAAIDAEADAYLPADGAMLTRVVERFAQVIRSAGYRPMLYANPNYLRYRYAPAPALPLWLAYYGVTEEAALAYKPEIWQPKELPAGSVPGIAAKVDADVGYFTAPSDPIRAGDRVRVVSPYIYGSIRRFAVYYDAYDVIAVNGDRAVIGIGSVVTAAVNVKNLARVAG